MFLKRLEINGFKSFAQKTTFEFSSGIVGIVGPNGSGKSNVIDALRWLLGERDTKSLRGAKIEDLIFAGSAKKPRMSQAQVSLVFDNAEGKLPLEYREVMITRKISRNGNSEYLINDAQVRLKDIIDFFSKIKLGTKGLTIIGQGSGDIFVKASPADRMMMVQEILGLREYQIKKAEAQRKLKNTKVNLDKVTAMIQEVAPRLRMLKRQTAKWEKRFEIEKELSDLESAYYVSRIRVLVAEKTAITRELPDIAARLGELMKKEQEAEIALRSIENTSRSSERIEEIGRTKKDLFAQKANLDREFFKLEAALERVQHALQNSGKFSMAQAHEALEEIREYVRSAESQETVAGLKDIIRSIARRIDSLVEPQRDEKDTQELERISQEKKRIAELVQAIERDITAIEEEERKIAVGMQDFNARFREAFNALEHIRHQTKELSDRERKIQFESEKNAYKLEELRHNVTSLGGSFDDFLNKAQDASFEVHVAEHELPEMERRILRLRGEIASIGEIDESLVKETMEVEAHHDHLVKESEDLSRASEDLFALIDELDEKITHDFTESFRKVNEEFNTYFRLMFNGGSAKMRVIKKERTAEAVHEEGEEAASEEERSTEDIAGIDIELQIPQKKVMSLETLSGGEKSLVSLAVLFALISVSPPPFLVLDEVDSALDEKNSKRFSDLVKNFALHTQFIVVTHNRVTMEVADVLYGVTMDEGGGSKVLSLKLEERAAAQ